jgi:acetyl esterase/lipase
MADALIQRTVLRGLLSLPKPILRLAAGGGVVYRGGRTLDPRFQFLASQARRLPALTTVGPIQARQAVSRGMRVVAGPREPGVAVEALSVAGAAGEIGARAYRPRNPDPEAPVLVYAHMGGGVICDLDVCDAFCSILAKAMRGPVLSVDYRLAPEHKFPAGLDDVMAAYRWARDQAARFGAAPGHAAIGGDSIGGEFAAAICQELRRLGEPQPALQLLIYPAVDAASETPSMTQYADAYPLSREMIDWFIGHYVGPDDDLADSRLSPARAQDLAGLAPALIATAGFDPLVDQGEAYARRLLAAGGAVTYRCYDALAHGFVAFTGAVPAAEAACREIAGLARQMIEGSRR